MALPRIGPTSPLQTIICMHAYTQCHAVVGMGMDVDPDALLYRIFPTRCFNTFLFSRVAGCCFERHFKMLLDAMRRYDRPSPCSISIGVQEEDVNVLPD